jgi:hypothetical protein
MTIVLMSYPDLPESISVSIRTDHHTLIHQNNSECTSWTNLFDLAGTTCLAVEPEPLNIFESIEAILAATFKEEPLEANFLRAVGRSLPLEFMLDRCCPGRRWPLSNNPSFRLKHTGVPDGSDGSDGTSNPLTENYTLPVAQATGRVAYSHPWLCARYTHHQNDTCVTLFAGAAVIL